MGLRGHLDQKPRTTQWPVDPFGALSLPGGPQGASRKWIQVLGGNGYVNHFFFLKLFFFFFFFAVWRTEGSSTRAAVCGGCFPGIVLSWETHRAGLDTEFLPGSLGGGSAGEKATDLPLLIQSGCQARFQVVLANSPHSLEGFGLRRMTSKHQRQMARSLE